MMNHGSGWMGGWMGGQMTIWAVLAVLVVIVVLVNKVFRNK
jgi:disulfide bond formation protein DsbB